MAMTARQLIAAAAACTVCGKEHKPRHVGTRQVSWSGQDGHAYRMRLHEMVNSGSEGTTIEALRLLAGES
jgi:hypothetical protein